ncbi:MAG: TIGR03862 family flavoprotein [Verrucomicrobiales bacterium]|nr:TIGR03862 family flavoprotein [Verrucomicrobiales bacterium]
MPDSPRIAIIGGGPAGLRAAEVAAGKGASVTLFDAMPSVGRKLLVAGKSGLNLTNDEPLETLLTRYSGPGLPVQQWQSWFHAFDNRALRHWAGSLGDPTFVSAGGKVFPTSMKAAPLLRRWVSKLRSLGVTFRMHHRWTGIEKPGTLTFTTPDGTHTESPDATIIALGGASWPQTGSTGSWPDLLTSHGVTVTPFAPANTGWETPWPKEILAAAEGAPLKNIAVGSAGQSSVGELVITSYGLEGAPLYRLGPQLRTAPNPTIEIDFKPTLTLDEVTTRLGDIHRNFVREARRRLKLCHATAALLKHLPDRGPWTAPAQLAQEIKHCRIPLTIPRPITEAISTAGGVAWSSLDHNLMLKNLPGTFIAGEMIDWEAPTGGYLLQAAFSTATHAASAAVHR